MVQPDTEGIVLARHAYGKDGIRVVTRGTGDDGPNVRDVTLSIRLEGDFAPAFIDGDNSTTLPTDSIANHARVAAAEHPLEEPEVYAELLLRRLMAAVPAAERASAGLRITPWERIGATGSAGFARAGWTGLADVKIDRAGGVDVSGGFIDLHLLLAEGSGFANFLRDPLTEQEDSTNRMLAGSLEAGWTLRLPANSFTMTRERVLASVNTSFAAVHSLGVQNALYRMGAEALEAVDGLEELSLTFVAEPRAALDLGRFGVSLPDVAWEAPGGPAGVTSATLRRR